MRLFNVRSCWKVSQTKLKGLCFASSYQPHKPDEIGMNVSQKINARFSLSKKIGKYWDAMQCTISFKFRV